MTSTTLGPRAPLTGPSLQPPASSLQRGYTFIELLVVSTIVLILASAIMPLARVTATRQRESDLRRVLREMRVAMDAGRSSH